MPINSHYVTRGITRPWEVGERRLCYYDFPTDKVCEQSSKSLLAQEDLLSSENEKRFNELIEQPLISAREEILKNPSHTMTWPQYRAAVLYFFAQSKRFGEFTGINIERNEDLNAFLSKDDKFLDGLATAMQAKFQLVGMDSGSGQQFFFPETGFFLFFFLDNSAPYQHHSGFAVPVTPTKSLALIPVGVDMENLERQRRYIRPFSVGLNDLCTKVIIPPDINAHNDHSTIISQIKDDRSKTTKMVKDLNQMKKLIDLMYTSVGLNVEDVKTQK